MFDKIAAHPEGISAARLAEQHSWSPSYTARLLDAQASFGLLKKTLGPDNIGIYHITETGKYMVSDFQGSFDGIFTIFSKRVMKSMSDIPDLIKSGEEGYKAQWVSSQLQTDGSADKQGPKDQQPLAEPKMPEGCQEKCAAGCMKSGMKERRMYQIMEALMYPYRDDIVRAFDLSGFKTVVDIGGGTGFLSYNLSRTYPDMKVTLMELPKAIKAAKEQFQPPDFDKLNVSYLEGNCLKDPIPDASLYVFCKVVHYFEEKKIEELMRKLHEKLPSGGAIMLIEDLLSPMRVGQPPANCFDLLKMTEKAGQNRTIEEYGSILERCGFAKFKCIRSNEESVYDMMMAIKD